MISFRQVTGTNSGELGIDKHKLKFYIFQIRIKNTFSFT